MYIHTFPGCSDWYLYPTCVLSNNRRTLLHMHTCATSAGMRKDNFPTLFWHFWLRSGRRTPVRLPAQYLPPLRDWFFFTLNRLLLSKATRPFVMLTTLWKISNSIPPERWSAPRFFCAVPRAPSCLLNDNLAITADRGKLTDGGGGNVRHDIRAIKSNSVFQY